MQHDNVRVEGLCLKRFDVDDVGSFGGTKRSQGTNAGAIGCRRDLRVEFVRGGLCLGAGFVRGRGMFGDGVCWGIGACF